MSQVRFTRELALGDVGADVEGVGRALSRAKLMGPLSRFVQKPARVRRMFGAGKTAAVKKLQKRHKLPVTGRYGKREHAALSPHFDAYAASLMEAWQPASRQEKAFAKLLASMQKMSADTPGYLLGGGHGVPLKNVRADQKLDCSSSTSKALYDAGLFGDREYALVSGQFDQWGEPGKGELFTVYYNADHVWVRLYRSKWWRFDTSPHGDGGRGPRLRMLPRFTSGFGTRHYRGM